MRLVIPVPSSTRTVVGLRMRMPFGVLGYKTVDGIDDALNRRGIFGAIGLLLQCTEPLGKLAQRFWRIASRSRVEPRKRFRFPAIHIQHHPLGERRTVIEPDFGAMVIHWGTKNDGGRARARNACERRECPEYSNLEGHVGSRLRPEASVNVGRASPPFFKG
jgi:hypothetical protein